MGPVSTTTYRGGALAPCGRPRRADPMSTNPQLSAGPASELAAAIEKLGKLHALQEQLPARIAEAEAEYVAAAGRLGFPLPGTKRGRAGAGPRRPRPEGATTGRRLGPPLGEASLAILDVVSRAGDVGATVGDIATALNTVASNVSSKLISMEKASVPRVVCDREVTPAVWRLTGPVPELAGQAVRAAAMDAAGVEA